MHDSDTIFARLVVEQGLARPEQVDECLGILADYAARGIQPLPSLGELLVRQGYLTPPQADRTLRLARPAPAEPPGERIGKYRRDLKLGEGGMGEVWKAWDPELRRWVALKFLKDHDPDEQARFRREAQTVAALNHPNIAAVFGVEADCIAMQFIDGRTLDAVPRDDRRRLVTLVRDAARAVHFAHERGVIHRDLKPANLMVEGDRVFVMDFGLARSMNVDAKLSRSGVIVGTPAYMSPEQATGGALDRRADVYSLGATLYEILAGRAPFGGSDVFTILKQIVERDPPAPRVGRELDTILMKCLEKDPARRYATAQELADDLQRWLSGEPIRAHPPSAFYRLRKFAARRKALVAAGIVAFAAVSFGLWKAYESRRRTELEARVQPKVERAREQVRSAQEMLFREKVPLDLWKGKLAEAERLCREAIAEHDGYAPAHLVLGLVEMERGRFDLAIDSFTRALERNPAYDQARIERAKAWVEKIFEFESEIPSAFGGQDVPEEERAAATRAIADLRAVDLAKSETEDRAMADLLLGLLERGPEGLADRVARMVESGVSDVRAWRVAGEAEHRHGHGSRALSCHERYLEIRRGDARAWSRYAHFLIDEDRWDDAWKAASRAVELNPDLADGYVTRAGALRGRGDSDGALAECAKAIEADPDHAIARALRADLRMSRGDLDGALAEYARALEAHPRIALLHVLRATAWHRKGDYAAAVASATRAVELRPRYSQAYSQRANAHRMLGEVEAAMADYAQAIELNPRNVLAFLNRAILRQERGDLEGARTDLDRAIEIDPRSHEGWYNRGCLRRDRKDFDGAIADFTTAIGLDPKGPNAYAARGRAHRERGDLASALADFTKAVDLDPKEPEFRFDRAEARRRGGDFDGAIADQTKVIELEPGNALARNERGLSLYLKGESGRAIADYTKAIELRPDLAEAYANRGMARADQGDGEGAVRDGTKALELNARLAVGYCARASGRRLQRDLAGAVGDLSQAVDLDPKLTQAWRMRADLRIETGDAKGAIGDYTRVIELDPAIAEAWWGRGAARARCGDPAGAEQDFTKAIELRPDEEGVYLNRGLMRIRTGDFAGAVKDLTKVLEFRGDDPIVLACRAEAREGAGDRRGAAEDARKALRLGLDPDQKRFMEALLRRVGD